MSLDHDDAPPSLDLDPPAYSQPTLPPPPVAEGPGPIQRIWSARWGARVVGGGLAIVGALTAGAYAVLPHGASSSSHAASPAPPAEVTVRLDALAQAFPENLAAEKTCSESDERIPLVLHSTLEALRTGATTPAAESALFSGSLADVKGASLTTKARRIAVLRTRDLRTPEASLGEPVAGRYEGDLVVFDASTQAPLCHATIRTWSSYTVVQPKISARTLAADYEARVRTAVAETASRLHVALDL